VIHLSLRHPWKFDLQGVWLPGGARVLGAFRKRKATFWATLERHRRPETPPSLAKDASVAVQQRPSAERARRLLSTDRGRKFW